MRGEILLARGRPQRALDKIEQESDKDWKLFGEAFAYHSLGKPNESDAALKQLIANGMVKRVGMSDRSGIRLS